MSRIGKQPIAIPKGVEVSVDGGVITFKKGSDLSLLDTRDRVLIELKDGVLNFALKQDDKESRAFWGTYRALANNIVVGMTSGFEKKLEINGVGYKAALKGSDLELQLGFSHPINFPIPKGVDISIEKNVLTIKGRDKQQIGQIAAKIREFRPPEPYKGKGVKYSDEKIIRKAGKASKK